VSGEEEIHAIRRSLGLDARAQDDVHRAGERILGDVDSWIERFYVRLVADPTAMRILRDEGRIVRLKRSLKAWFAEMLSLPFDAEYQRAREQIGRVHVRIGMPQHLMVTAMNGARSDVLDSVARAFGDEPAIARRVGDAVGKALDMELALMLGAYGRRTFELRRRMERTLVEAHLAGGLARERREAVDAARCYAALATRETDPPARELWTSRLRAVLDGLGREPQSAIEGPPAVHSDVGEVCQRALAEVSVPPETELALRVDAPGAEGWVHPEALESALRDLVQEAVNRTPAGTVEVRVRPEGEEVWIEVVDSGACRPDAGATGHGSPEGIALSYASQVAKLHGGALEVFERPAAGNGVRLRLGDVRARGD
jgi:signal transduction histidine kinase